MNVSAVVVTRGDVDLSVVLDSLPHHWEKVVVDNSRERQDFKVYGRYVGAQRASHDVVYVQDDDCVVEDPQALVSGWVLARDARDKNNHVVCNMPPEFRHAFYGRHALVGFGAVFHRSIIEPAFQRYLGNTGYMTRMLNPQFLRCCDIPFTALNDRVLANIPKHNLEWADAPDRMWKHPAHFGERAAVLERCLQISNG